MGGQPIEGRYTLKYPISLKGGAEAVREVIILRPKGKDRLVIDEHLTPEGGIIGPMRLQLRMIERLCRLPDGSDIFPGFAEELDDEDVDALGELVMPDLPNGPKTGGTPSAS